jgi:ribosomal protein S26
MDSMKAESVVCSFCGKTIPADRAFQFASRKSCWECESQYVREVEDAVDAVHHRWMKRPVVVTEEPMGMIKEDCPSDGNV